MSTQQILHRLKKRKIVQWTLTYIAGGWLLLEAFDLVAEQFFWPAWIRQSATVMLLFGLLVTLVLAWYHGEKGRQRVSAFEVLLLVCLLALAGNSIWLLKSNDRHGQAPISSIAGEPATPIPLNSVAVLPCLNRTGDPDQAHFADGLALELITRLNAVKGLNVPGHLSSFRFRESDQTGQQIAAALRVRHLLECDLRGDESRLRVSARLLDVNSGYLLWSDSWQHTRENLFDIQQIMASAITSALKIELADGESELLTVRWTDNPEAYEHFLKGIALQAEPPRPDNISRVRHHLEKAIRLDAEFARAHARLGMHWIIVANFLLDRPSDAYRRARVHAERALELDRNLFEAFWVLGWAEFSGAFNWQKALDHFDEVVRLAPGEWGGHHSRGFVLGTLGRTAEGLEAADSAISSDPLAFWPKRGRSILLTRQRNYDASLENLERAAEIHDLDPVTNLQRAVLMSRAGRETDARRFLSTEEGTIPDDPAVQLTKARLYAILGEKEQAIALSRIWEARIDASESETGQAFISPGLLAAIHAQLDNTDEAMEWLHRARAQMDIMLLFLDLMEFDSLRGDPRFQAFIKSLNLPAEVYLNKANGTEN